MRSGQDREVTLATMHPGGWAQHICIEPMARVSVELLPGAEWRGRQRIIIPPSALSTREIHPLLHAPQPTPTSLLAEVRGVLVDTFSAAINWRTHIAGELERVFSHCLEREHQKVLQLPQISSAKRGTPATDAADVVDWESLASQWREDNLTDSTEFVDGVGLTDGTVARCRGLDRIVAYLRPAMKVGHEPQKDELDRLARAWLRLPAWDDVPAGLSTIRSAYMVAAIDPATSLWDLTALTKYSQMVATARMSPGHSPPRTPSRGSTPPVGLGPLDWVGDSRPHTPGSPGAGYHRLDSPIGSHRRPSSRQRRRPKSRDGRPSSRDGLNFALGGGTFVNQTEGGLEWDMTLPPMGSLEQIATYDRIALLLGHLPSAMLLMSSNPHALLTAQRAGWRTAYVARPGVSDHPRLPPNAAPAENKPPDNIPAGPRSVGRDHAEASLRMERVFGSTYDGGSNSSIQQTPNEATSEASESTPQEEPWDGSMFDVAAVDMGTLATMLVPPHTRRWRP